MSKNSTFPSEQKPLVITEYQDKAIRTRLVEIEHKKQSGTRSKNAIHIELFDELKIGRLQRIEHEMIATGDSEEFEYDQGIFLCGRNSKDVVIYHSNSNVPTCSKCIDIANRLIKNGLDIYTVSKENWEILQHFYYKNIADRMRSNIDQRKIEELKKDIKNI